MEGVILFADDEVFKLNSFENKLFQKINKDSKYTVLPINRIESLEKSIASISTYKALILDWTFKKEVDDDEDIDGIEVPPDNPLEFLREQKIFSLIYIYSREIIPDNIQDELKSIYPNKISFNTKPGLMETSIENEEYKKIADGIEKYEKDYKHLSVPYAWSQSINSSVQLIFKELEEADQNWVRELYQTAQNDGSEPEIEVTNIFLNLLKEHLIQQKPFLDSLKTYIKENKENISETNYSAGKLYQRIFYTKLTQEAPLMTGDIFKFDDSLYGILFTPACDIQSKKDIGLEFLLFKKDDIDGYFIKKWSNFKRSETVGKLKTGTKKEKENLAKLGQHFNNGEMKVHILPSFPFEKDIYNHAAIIRFQTSLIVLKPEYFKDKERVYKLNTPYVYQLRQRFLAYIGRVGVPAIPTNLKLYNLQEMDSPQK